VLERASHARAISLRRSCRARCCCCCPRRCCSQGSSGGSTTAWKQGTELAVVCTHQHEGTERRRRWSSATPPSWSPTCRRG